MRKLSAEYLAPRYQQLLAQMGQPEFQKTLQQERIEIIKKTDRMLKELQGLQETGMKGCLKAIQLSFLHSSNINGTYTYELECLSQNIFDESPVRDYWVPMSVYRNLDSDKDFFRSIAKKKIIRVPEYEIEEFLHGYSLLYFDITSMLFLSAVKPALFELDSFRQVKKDPEILVLLGGHMDRVVVLDTYREEEVGS